MTTVHFTSDPHWGHRLVAVDKRGFATAEEHDDALSEAWVERVHRDDSVWILGDLATSSPEHALDRIAALPGRKHLVWGNHDAGHPMHRSSFVQHARYLRVFDSVQQSARRRVGGQEVLLNHHPYEGDHTEVDRDPQWRPRDYGVPILHGHVHLTEVITRTTLGTLQIHVGADAWAMSPVPIDTISSLIKEHLHG